MRCTPEHRFRSGQSELTYIWRTIAIDWKRPAGNDTRVTGRVAALRTLLASCSAGIRTGAILLVAIVVLAILNLTGLLPDKVCDCRERGEKYYQDLG